MVYLRDVPNLLSPIFTLRNKLKTLLLATMNKNQVEKHGKVRVRGLHTTHVHVVTVVSYTKDRNTYLDKIGAQNMNYHFYSTCTNGHGFM